MLLLAMLATLYHLLLKISDRQGYFIVNITFVTAGNAM